MEVKKPPETGLSSAFGRPGLKMAIVDAGPLPSPDPSLLNTTLPRKISLEFMAASATPVATTSLESSSLSQSDEALKVAVFQRLHPRAYLERFLAESIRPDKRLCDGFRDVHVNVGEFIFFFFLKRD